MKIQKTLDGNILVGVADSTLPNNRFHWNEPNVVYYRGDKGRVRGDGVGEVWKRGKKFNTGDIVTMNVDLAEG